MGDTRSVPHDQLVVLVKARAFGEPALEVKVAACARARRFRVCFSDYDCPAMIWLNEPTSIPNAEANLVALAAVASPFGECRIL